MSDEEPSSDARAWCVLYCRGAIPNPEIGKKRVLNILDIPGAA